MTAIDLPAGTAPDAVPDARLARWTRLLCVLFFFSGVPALIYQLTWQRALFRIFGVNIESVTIVVTAFMLGLGLGSLAGGWLSKRRGVALLPMLAAIEFLTGIFGLFSLAIFDRVGTLTGGWSLAAMAAVNLGLVIVPTLLMGATLPLLVGHLVRRSGEVGNAVGTLYYVNTLGAGAACLLASVALFPFLGMQGAVRVAVVINVAVALGALYAHRLDRGGSPPAIALARPSSTERPALGFAPVVLLAAFGGFVALSYEIFLFRTVSYASGSSATAFAATLSAFLVGIASGARGAGEASARLPSAIAMRGAADAVLRANLVGLLFLPLLTHLAWLDRGVVGVAMLIVFLVAKYWGALLPYLAQFGIAADGRAGLRTGILYLANIVGSAAGAILTGFVLMDVFGLIDIAVALALVGSACAVLLVLALALSWRERWPRLALAGGVCAAAVVLLPPLSARVLENLQFKTSVDHAFRRVVENRSGIITVDRDGTVFGNGMYDGRFNTDLKHDTNGVLRPYALSLFHPAPRDVLMIGLSSGSWAQIIASNPAVERLTVVEINPGYVSLVAEEPEVASLLRNPKVTIVADDGRRWLDRHPDRSFDAVVSNTTWHFRANVTNLLSLEFLDRVKAHLNPGGVFFYNTTDSDRAQRTGCTAFPYGARFTNHMVVSEQPIDWDFVRWRRVLEAYRIDGQLLFDPARPEHRAMLDALMELRSDPAHPIEPCPEVLARTAGRRPMTDDNMGTEWRYSLGLD